MSKIVALAVQHGKVNLNLEPSTTWNVTFMNNETVSGKIEHIGGGQYHLDSRSSHYYFSDEKVMYMQPNL
ncbi:hypothetical protein O3301_26650 [Janthinobacterium sp. SUN211]|uniref:hypothetical protein n=1 Tax=Janthinobacterium sp. SUN211 TaxID=3014786 RepID=UPI002712E9E2|nr:hypothetical protein [Janthinobacterium sp. SUN211]MDO8052055.1 hypothetical protein [Janthinobacterium sp. SUN211]